MVFLSVALLLMALLGHAALWAAAVNRLHGLPVPRPLMGVVTFAMFLGTASIPAVLLVWLIWARVSPLHLTEWFLAWLPLTIYTGVCWAGRR